MQNSDSEKFLKRVKSEKRSLSSSWSTWRAHSWIAWPAPGLGGSCQVFLFSSPEVFLFERKKVLLPTGLFVDSNSYIGPSMELCALELR